MLSSEPQRIGADVKDENCNQKACETTPVEKIDKKFKVQGSDNMSVDSQRISTEGGSSGKRTGRPYRRLGDGVVQVLLLFIFVESSAH